ncbi:MAG: AAA family ATPase, partial [Sphingomicrobium sp.]
MIAAWRPLREASHSNRFAAKNAVRRTFAGRGDELAMLTAQWAQIVQGDGRASVILGEAGIGKSRLLEEMRAHIDLASNAFLGWQCSAFHQMKPLYPIIEQITRAADIVEVDDGQTRLAKLETLLATAAMPIDRTLPLFADLLSLPIDAGYAMLDLTPAQRKSATIAALGDWIRRIAEVTPLLLDLEDAHWADASTLEVINLLINGLSGVPLMVIVTGRPEFAAPWVGRAKVMVIGLGRLNDAECEGMIREIIATETVSSSAILKILEHSDGNPLFVEELSAAFAQSDPSDHQAVPETLQGSLMARLDQLGDAKRTAQLCAVLGRHFARPLLVQLADSAAALVDTNLSLLVANDIIHPLGRANEGRYRFKHALVRDAAYESLLLAERGRLHERCGRQLERAFPEVVETEPELLAYHFREAGLASDAATYLDLAGDHASNSAGYIEAVASYRGALEQLAKLAESDDRTQRELAILLKLGPPLSIIDGAQGTGVRKVYQRAEVLGRAIQDLDGRFKALWGLWYNANVGRDYSTASDFAEKLVELSEQSLDDDHRLEALHCRWSSAMFRGECLPCINDAALGEDLYRADKHHRLAAIFGGHDPGVCAYGCSAASQATAGQFDSALQHIEDGVALAEKLQHPHSIAHALMMAITVATAAGDFSRVRTNADALGAIADAYNFPPQRAVAAFFVAWATVRTGDSDLAPLRTTF